MKKILMCLVVLGLYGLCYSAILDQNFPGERKKESKIGCGGFWDSLAVLKDTVVDCNHISIVRLYLAEDHNTTRLDGRIDAPRDYCDVNSIVKESGLEGFRKKTAFLQTITCKRCGVDRKDTTAYDSILTRKTKDGYRLKQLICDNKVIEDRIIYDKRRYRSKIYLLDTTFNDTLFHFYLNSRFDGDSLLLRSVDVDTVLVKTLKRNK